MEVAAMRVKSIACALEGVMHCLTTAMMGPSRHDYGNRSRVAARASTNSTTEPTARILARRTKSSMMRSMSCGLSGTCLLYVGLSGRDRYAPSRMNLTTSAQDCARLTRTCHQTLFSAPSPLARYFLAARCLASSLHASPSSASRSLSRLVRMLAGSLHSLSPSGQGPAVQTLPLLCPLAQRQRQ
jgi:hypothetical protein